MVERANSPRDAALVAASDPWAERLGQAGITTVGDLLARGEVVRALPSRSNHEVVLADRRLHVKVVAPGAGPDPVRGLTWAAEAGLPVPAVAATARQAGRGVVLVTEDVAPARPLDALLASGGLPGAARRRLVRALAAAVAALHEAGGHHRDLYLNHVYVDPDREDPLVAILDWDRLGRHRRAFGQRVVKDLAALLASCPADAVGTAEQGRFLAHYLRARGRRLARGRRRRLARRVSRKALRIRRHAPRTPVGAAARPREPLA